MNIPYSKDFDSLIKQKQTEIALLTKQSEKEREQYLRDMDFSCETCRYAWLEDVDTVDMHALCERGRCKLCWHICDDYAPETEVSVYLSGDNHKYDYEEARLFHDLFSCYMADMTTEKLEAFYEMLDLMNQIKMVV